MSEAMEVIICSIKEDYPDASEEGIEKAIIDYIESNLPEILGKIHLPSLKDLRTSDPIGRYQQARHIVKAEKLQEDRSVASLVYRLTRLQEEFSDWGLKQDADSLAKHIRNIEDASAIKIETLMYVNSHLSERLKREETDEEDRDSTVRKLKALGETAND